jgi:DNA-binding transcriptional MerR regulator
LRPSSVDGNDYRFYTARDVYTFDLISALKDIGYTLAEIKEYLNTRDPEAFIGIMCDGQKKLETERRKIESRERLFASSIAKTESAMAYTIGKIEFVRRKEEYLIAHEASANPAAMDKTTFARVREHIDYCREKDFNQSFPIGLIYRWADVEADPVQGSSYFTKIGERIDDPHFRLKPAGLYATLYYQRAYDTVADALCALKKFVERKGYKAAGDAYEEDLQTFFTTKDADDFIYTVSVRVWAP